MQLIALKNNYQCVSAKQKALLELSICLQKSHNACAMQNLRNSSPHPTLSGKREKIEPRQLLLTNVFIAVAPTCFLTTYGCQGSNLS